MEVLKMTLQPIPDQGVLKTADAFWKASQRLNNSDDSSMTVPSIVNAAFALELYLKSLNMEWQLKDPSCLGKEKAFLKSRTAIQKGYKPSKLFKKLDANIKNKLKQKYGQHHQGSKLEKLENVLESYDDIFEDWRYIFEGGCNSLNLPSLLLLLKFFSEELHALPQNWA